MAVLTPEIGRGPCKRNSLKWNQRKRAFTGLQEESCHSSKHGGTAPFLQKIKGAGSGEKAGDSFCTRYRGRDLVIPHRKPTAGQSTSLNYSRFSNAGFIPHRGRLRPLSKKSNERLARIERTSHFSKLLTWLRQGRSCHRHYFHGDNFRADHFARNHQLNATVLLPAVRRIVGGDGPSLAESGRGSRS